MTDIVTTICTRIQKIVSECVCYSEYTIQNRRHIANCMVISRIKALFLEHLSCQWILLCFIMYEWHRLELNSSYESTNIMKKKNVIYKYKEIVLFIQKNKHLQSIGFRYCSHVSTKAIWPTHKVLKITNYQFYYTKA